MKKILFFIAIVVTIVLSPGIIFSQAPVNLGRAINYVLYTGNGAFISTSSSAIIIGNVGNGAGTVSAFPPGFLAGNKHFADSTTGMVTADVTAAYNDLSGRTCGNSHGGTFGNNETLIPGIYCSAAATTLTGNLTLDAGGNANAIFIIKVTGSFTAASGSQIILLNNATACNVYWQVNGDVVLNNAVFKGNLLADSSISLEAGTILSGRALTTSGSITFDAITASVCDAAALPLKLVSFDAVKTADNNVSISWITGSEINVDHYDIEASVNGTAFYTVGSVASKNNSYATKYTIEDIRFNKTGLRFYRLKMVDKDGVFTYSGVRSIKFSDLANGLINVYPNPATNTINITINAATQQNLVMTIRNMVGQVIRERKQDAAIGINNFTEDIQTLSKGAYVLSVRNIATGEESHQNFQKL